MGNGIGQCGLTRTRFPGHQERATQMNGGVDHLDLFGAGLKFGLDKAFYQHWVDGQRDINGLATETAPGWRRLFDKVSKAVVRFAAASKELPVTHIKTPCSAYLYGGRVGSSQSKVRALPIKAASSRASLERRTS